MIRILKNFLKPTDIEQLLLFADQAVFEPGRQGTGYDKAYVPPGLFFWLRQTTLWALGVSLDIAYDCYLVRYNEGCWIPLHKDDAPLAQEHHRLNAMITMPEQGGELIVEGQHIELAVSDAYVFRPDLQEHEVKPVQTGTRLIWSVGVLQ
jgi:hypothetical protein